VGVIIIVVEVVSGASATNATQGGGREASGRRWVLLAINEKSWSYEAHRSTDVLGDLDL
jgi:hypothetical protein